MRESSALLHVNIFKTFLESLIKYFVFYLKKNQRSEVFFSRDENKLLV